MKELFGVVEMLIRDLFEILRNDIRVMVFF